MEEQRTLFIDQFCPKYKLIEDIVYHILSGCDVHNGLRCIDKLHNQVLVLLGAIAHREAGLHGVELIPGLDLCRGQCYRCAMMNAMKGDLLGTGWNIVETGIDEGGPGIDGRRSHVRR